MTSFLLLRSLHTPFASFTVIKFFIYVRRFRVLLTWLFSKTSLIWSRNIRLCLPLPAIPKSASKISFVNLLSSNLFTGLTYLNILFSDLVTKSSFTPHSFLITSFLPCYSILHQSYLLTLATVPYLLFL
jgi:hypothetical protein